jgi:hypothetical protein
LKYNAASAGSAAPCEKPPAARRSAGAVGGRGQVQFHAVEVPFRDRLLRRAEFVEGFLRRLVEVAARRGHRIVQLPAGKAPEVRRGRQQQHDLVGFLTTSVFPSLVTGRRGPARAAARRSSRPCPRGRRRACPVISSSLSAGAVV